MLPPIIASFLLTSFLSLLILKLRGHSDLPSYCNLQVTLNDVRTLTVNFMEHMEWPSVTIIIESIRASDLFATEISIFRIARGASTNQASADPLRHTLLS